MSDKDKKQEKSSVEKQLVELSRQAADNLAGWQKALADYQNLQKESDQKIVQLRTFVKTDLIHELLPIFDNYRLAMEHVPADMKNESWVVGLQHTLKIWDNFLADHGVKKVVTVGHKFDTQWHESIGMVSDKEQPDHIVVEEKQAGYQLNDLLIRPAKVIINNISK